MKTKNFLVLVFTVYFAAMTIFFLFEPEILRAADDNDSVAISLTVSSEITISCDDTAPLSGTINSISGGSATGNFSCTVTTPDTNGYNVKVKHNQTLQIAGGGANKEFPSHATNTPLSYAFASPSSGGEVFGFSLNADTSSPVQAYKNNGSACNQAAGSVTNGYCWNGFTVSDQEVANKASAASAETVKLNLRAEAAGSNALQPGGYSNTVTVTATVNI